MYQLSPTASKRNAFCWLSYEAQINWRRSQPDNGQAKRDEILEDPRADLSSAARMAPLNPARFTVATGRRA